MKKIIILITLLFLSSCISQDVDNKENIKQEIKKIKKVEEIENANLDNYKEIDLNLENKSDEFQNNVFVLDEKFVKNINNKKEDKRDDKDEFVKLDYLNLACGKFLEDCKKGSYGVKYFFIKEMFDKAGFPKFYKTQSGEIIGINDSGVYKQAGDKKEVIFKPQNYDLFSGANGVFSSPGEYKGKIGVKFLYVDTSNNKFYNENNCKVVIDEFNDKLSECKNIANKIKDKTEQIKQRKKCYNGYDDNKEYNDCIGSKYDNKFIKTNLWYNGIDINKKYGVDSSLKLFFYNYKIGFIGEQKGKLYVFYDGKIVSNSFDNFKENACCMNIPFPFLITKSGLLHYVFERGGKYYIGIINLKGKK